MGLFNFVNINKFAKFFSTKRFDDDVQSKQEIINSQGYSQEQLDLRKQISNLSSEYEYNNESSCGMTSINIQFEEYFSTKLNRISKYREMSYYPDISDALDIISDDAVLESIDGSLVDLEIKRELPQHIDETIRQDWTDLIEDVFNFNEIGWDLFRKFLVDGELYIELILNSQGSDIIGIKVLPPHTMAPVYEDGKIVGYVQSVNSFNINEVPASHGEEVKDNVLFDKDQVVHISYGTGLNKYDVKGFLESCVRVYNQLKNLEDAVVIYRISRSAERRIWNVATRNMPKTKAEEYIKGLMQRYRKRIKYDSSTGAMDSAQNVQAMIEDYWFAKGSDGEQTTVDTLPAAQNLGEMEDVKYFQKKLYKNLKLPSTRWSDVETGNQYSTGKSGEVSQEEIKFSNFITRLQKKFKYVLFDTFIIILRLRGRDDAYLDYSLYNIKFSESNLYKRYKELELLESRFALLGNIDSFIYKPEENPNGYFSQEFVLRKWFMMTDEEFELNKMLKEKENLTFEAKQIEAGFDNASDNEEDEFGVEKPEVNTTASGFGGATGGNEPVGTEEETPEEVPATEETPEEVTPEESFTFKIKGKTTPILQEFVNINRGKHEKL
jgi:hypothetical protein